MKQKLRFLSLVPLLASCVSAAALFANFQAINRKIVYLGIGVVLLLLLVALRHRRLRASDPST